MKKYIYKVASLLFFTLVLTSQVQLANPSSIALADCTPSWSQPDCNCPPSTTVKQNCIVTNYIKPAINFLSIGVGIIVIAMVIVGAIQYSGSGGNPQTVSAAKKKIFNALLALLLFALSYAFLNFIIPGGLVTL